MGKGMNRNALGQSTRDSGRPVMRLVSGVGWINAANLKGRFDMAKSRPQKKFEKTLKPNPKLRV